MAYDLIVIGGGPAGYVGAIRAAQLGKKVACVEMDRAGGTCLNWGCIPTKSLLKNAEMYSFLQNEAEAFGFSFKDLSYDWSKVMSRSRGVADNLAGGIEFLFKKNGVDYLPGKASIPESGKVEVTGSDGKSEVHETAHVLVSTGCVSRPFPGFPFEGTKVIGSKQALVLEKQPKSMVIIGAGAIGIEFAYFYNAFGTEVTVVEMMPQILPVEDDDIGAALGKSFKKQGINCLTNTKVTGTKTTKTGVEITVETADGKTEVLKAETALVAIGVQPVLPETGPGIEFKLDRGYIEIDGHYGTSIDGVYAAGDISGPPWLAHTASYEAIQCVEGLFTDKEPKRVGTFPGCTYCQPQVASVGLTERAAKEKGLGYQVGMFPFAASGKAQAAGHTEGFVKVLYGKEHGEILGAHIIGSEATEMIAELGLAIEMEATHEEIEATIHAHPTLSEAVHEATGQAYGHAIHIPN